MGPSAPVSRVRLCEGCPVRHPCLMLGLAVNIDSKRAVTGIYGGEVIACPADVRRILANLNDR